MSELEARKIILPGVDDDSNATLNLLQEQLVRKMRRNRLRQAYYDMKIFVRRVSSIIPPQYYRLGIVLGWSGKAVDTLSDRCNLDSFVWPDGDLDSLGFREVWEGNSFRTEFKQAGVSSLIHATAFVVNTRGEGDDPADGMIHFKDAMNATGEWNVRTRRLNNLLSINERDKQGDPSALTLYLYNRTISARKDRGLWEVVDDQDHSWGVPAEPLPYQPRLGRPFGRSRITRTVMGTQDAATRTTVRLEAHEDIYSIPDLWMLGAAESIFKNADGSQKTSWDIVMGRIKAIPDDEDAPSDALARADVKQIPSASPQPHLDTFRQQAQTFSGETSIPLTSLGVSDMSNPTSSDSYIASREDLIARAEGTTDDWSPYLRRSFVRGLAMQNGLSGVDAIPDEWKTIEPKWRSPIYLSRAAQADAGMKQITAVPDLANTEVGLELLGLDDQQIRRVMAERRRNVGSALLQQLQQAAAPGAK